jgi:hypothetical protein
MTPLVALLPLTQPLTRVGLVDTLLALVLLPLFRQGEGEKTLLRSPTRQEKSA